MIMSGLVAFSAPVIADTQVVNNSLEVVFNPAFMVDELVWSKDPTVNNPYNLGEGDGIDDDATTADSCTLRITIRNIDADAAQDFYLNITQYQASVFDFRDTVAATAGVQVSVGPVAIASGATANFNFNFDILATNIPLGTSSNTQITFAWDYIDAGGPTDVTGNRNGHIYIASIFDNPAEDLDEQLPNMEDENDDAEFEAGDLFEEAEMDLHNYELGTDNIDDLTCVVTVPASSGITFSGGRDTCMIPAGINVGTTASTLYRVDVAAGTPPGVYTGSADITYTRADSGLTVTENDLAVDFEVDFSFDDDDPVPEGELYSQYQCYATGVTVLNYTRQVDYVAPYDIPVIEQSDYTDQTLELEVTIINNGNSDLYNVEFELDPAGWPYFRNPLFFWESAGTLNYDSISDTIDIAAGDSITFTMTVFVDAAIPIGEHRLQILYRGYYFDDGSLGNPTGFIETNGGDDLEILFSIWVDDPVIQCHISAIDTTVTDEVGDKDDIRAETLTISVVNDEEYNFIDITARADFTGTPWYMPVINMADPWVAADNANPAMPLGAWNGGATMDLDFTVDTYPTFVPDRYPFSLEITAVIQETLEIVTVVLDYTQGAVIDFTGYGPDIYITGFTAEDIVPGEPFELVLEIRNVGDDTLRDVTLQIDTDGTDEYPWDIEQDFKEQFDWSGVFDNWGGSDATVGQSGGVTWNGDFPEDMFYTVEDLDVDNIREIIEINLFMDGVYSDPAASIALIHISDLAAGANTTVTFTMITDKDMVNGKPYDFPVWIWGIGADGEDYEAERWITVQTSIPGDSYNPVELNWFDAGLKALALFLFFIIVLAILLFVYNMFKGEPYDEDEEDFDFEDEEPFEPETEAPGDTPVEKKEELVEP